MRITVISDSHGNTAAIDKILRAEPQSKDIFFLGDNAYDIEDFPFLYPDRNFRAVRGNCDFASVIKAADEDIVADKKIFFCHGHNYAVKYGKGKIIEAARQRNADIVLFGHTHIPEILYEEGIYFVNPGSCSEPRDSVPTYAVIDITDAGILPAIKKLG